MDDNEKKSTNENDKHEQETPAEDKIGEAEVVVGVTLEEFDEIQKELESARAQAEENLEGWQRALADYSNLKRRVEQERKEMHHAAVANVIKPFLDVLDDLDRALKMRTENGVDDNWAAGIENIYRKLLSTLEVQGVKVMEADGQMFDPVFHEAISHEKDEKYESGQIIEVVKPGYMIGERVLRPALVRVAA